MTSHNAIMITLSPPAYQSNRVIMYSPAYTHTHTHTHTQNRSTVGEKINHWKMAVFLVKIINNRDNHLVQIVMPISKEN